MRSNALVQLALEKLRINQRELAARLNVSPAQISKWKKGDYMSREMEDRLIGEIGLSNRDPEFVLMAGSVRDADKWASLIDHLAEIAVSDCESGYRTPPLEDQDEDSRSLLYVRTFEVLRDMGIAVPASFPAELRWDGGDDLTESEHQDLSVALFEEHPISSVIYSVYKSLTDVYGFYAAYVSTLIDDDSLDFTLTDAANIEPELIRLAASKIPAPRHAKEFARFRLQVQKEYQEWLTIVKDKAFRAGIPLRAELLELVFRDADSLGHSAEAESFGFNDTRLHPDIYMNELLQGMRLIHQVLPAILKKLGMEEEFQIDERDLRIR